MKKYWLFPGLVALILTGIILNTWGCTGHTTALTQSESITVQSAVRQMTDNIASDVSGQGPSAWLQYFAETPQFFMASGGQLAFPNNDSARVFIQNTLSKTIRRIHLSWDDMRIDPLTTTLAGVAAYFHETIADSSGKQINTTGYFTGIAQKTAHGWQLRNAHWSYLHDK